MVEEQLNTAKNNMFKINITLAFVSKEKNRILKKWTFKGNNQLNILIRMWSWVNGSMVEGFTPEKCRLIAINNSQSNNWLIDQLKKCGIPVLNSIEDFNRTS